MIHCENLAARYPGADADALSSVTLRAARGRFTAVAGPNGSGKSTIVRALLGRVPITGGEILIDGRVRGAWSASELAHRLAVVVQREEPAFPMPVREYVTLGRHPFRRPWSALTAADRDAVESSLAQAGVSHLQARSTDALREDEDDDDDRDDDDQERPARDNREPEAEAPDHRGVLSHSASHGLVWSGGHGTIEPQPIAPPDGRNDEQQRHEHRATPRPAGAGESVLPVPSQTEAQALKDLRAVPIYFASSYSLVKPYVTGFDTNVFDAPSLKKTRLDTSWKQTE